MKWKFYEFLIWLGYVSRFVIDPIKANQYLEPVTKELERLKREDVRQALSKDKADEVSGG